MVRIILELEEKDWKPMMDKLVEDVFPEVIARLLGDIVKKVDP